jgi:hypothetical protein
LLASSNPSRMEPKDQKVCMLVHKLSYWNAQLKVQCTVPEIINPVFAKTRSIRSVSMTEYDRLGLVFTKTRVYKFGHCTVKQLTELTNDRRGENLCQAPVTGLYRDVHHDSPRRAITLLWAMWDVHCILMS